MPIRFLKTISESAIRNDIPLPKSQMVRALVPYWQKCKRNLCLELEHYNVYVFADMGKIRSAKTVLYTIILLCIDFIFIIKWHNIMLCNSWKKKPPSLRFFVHGIVIFADISANFFLTVDCSLALTLMSYIT